MLVSSSVYHKPRSKAVLITVAGSSVPQAVAPHLCPSLCQELDKARAHLGLIKKLFEVKVRYAPLPKHHAVKACR